MKVFGLSKGALVISGIMFTLAVVGYSSNADSNGNRAPEEIPNSSEETAEPHPQSTGTTSDSAHLTDHNSSYCSSGRSILLAIRDVGLEGQSRFSINCPFANLSGANLLDADLGWANLQGADLRWANLQGADLGGADLRFVDLQVADLRWAKLQGTKLSWANLQGADLRWANLRWAKLQGTKLSWANLRKADLRGADLRDAYLQNADLRGAIYSDGTLFPKNILPKELGMVLEKE